MENASRRNRTLVSNARYGPGDDRFYYPLHVEPYTPKRRGAGKEDAAAFRSKPQIALALTDAALEMGIEFRVVVADSFYGDNLRLEGELSAAEVPYLLAVKPSRGVWAPAKEAHTPEEAARRLKWAGPSKPRDWTGVERAPGEVVGSRPPARELRARPQHQDGGGDDRPGDLVRTLDLVLDDQPAAIYGLRMWGEQNYKQVKQELGWADFMVRSDRAIRRHSRAGVLRFYVLLAGAQSGAEYSLNLYLRI